MITFHLQKKAPAAVPKTEPQAPAPETKPDVVPTAAPEPAAEAAPASAAAAPAAPATAADPYSAAASELATGSALEEKISQIMDMGFPRDEVVRAMRAAFNNPERAVEYLMTGIPAGLEPPAAAAGAAAPAGGAPAAPQAAEAPAQPFNMFGPAPTAGAAAGGGGGGGGSLDALRQNPQFQMLRSLVQQNPALLQPMLQELGKNNPQLLAQINSNQSEFLSIINEPVAVSRFHCCPFPSHHHSAYLLSIVFQIYTGYCFLVLCNNVPSSEAYTPHPWPVQMEGDMQALMGQIMQGGGEEETLEIELTEEEAAAISRLEGLGFPKDLCIEAFLICDKNEEAAANYLLENAAGDMM